MRRRPAGFDAIDYSASPDDLNGGEIEARAPRRKTVDYMTADPWAEIDAANCEHQNINGYGCGLAVGNAAAAANPGVRARRRIPLAGSTGHLLLGDPRKARGRLHGTRAGRDRTTTVSSCRWCQASNETVCDRDCREARDERTHRKHLRDETVKAVKAADGQARLRRHARYLPCGTRERRARAEGTNTRPGNCPTWHGFLRPRVGMKGLRIPRATRPTRGRRVS